jgi:hypothetical protein
LHRGSFEWHYLHTRLHVSLPNGSEVISGGLTSRQTGDLIGILPYLESRLKILEKCGKQLYRFEEMSMNYDMRPFSLSLNQSFAFSNAVLNDVHILK